MTLWSFAQRSDPQSFEEADWAAALAAALLADSSVNLALIPAAGLIHLDHLYPALLVDAKWLGRSPRDSAFLVDLPFLHSLIIRVLGAERHWFGKVFVLPVTPPAPQVSPGDDITRPAGGKIGCQVSWNAGAGFVTAGHVAPTAGSDVHDTGAKIGTVVWANDPSGHGKSIEPDISIVECTSGVTVSSTISGTLVASPASSVTVTSSGTTGTIMGHTHYLHMGAQNATFGETYFTTADITAGGDSGSPVMVGSDIIGHVVGASVGVCSYIQAVDYQLREAASRGGLAGLTL